MEGEVMERQHRNSTPWTWLLGVLLVGSASLVFALGLARGDTVEPLISLGPTSVQNGVATVAVAVAGDPSATANVTINGQPVGVNAGGEINASVNLNGRSSLEISLTNPQTGERSTITIPLTTNLVGAGGQVAESALAPLQQAGISLVKPPDGFQSTDGQPLQLVGRVLDASQLSSLNVNGIELLKLLGSNGSFSVPASGSSKEVVFTATDKQGVSQTNTYPVTQVSSLIKTGAGTSVSALGAKGLRISKIRYITTGVRSTKRIRAVITVRDLRGYLVRDAIIQHSSLKPARVKGGTQFKLSGRLGTATFAWRLLPKAFGKRFYSVTTAKTPGAKVRKVSSVALPRLAARKR
jgi:hypothetical protein